MIPPIHPISDTFLFYNRFLNNSNASFEQAMDKVIHILLITRGIKYNTQGGCGY